MNGDAMHYGSVDADTETDEQHPAEQAGRLSRIFYWWVVPVIQKIKRDGGFTEEELPPPRGEDRSVTLYRQFSKRWETQRGRKRLSLIRCVLGINPVPIALLLLGSVIVGAIPIFQTVLVGRLVDYLVASTNSVTPAEAYCYGATVAFLAFIQSFIANHVVQQGDRCGQQCRAILTIAIYKTVLYTDFSKLKQEGSGKIFALLSSEIETIDMATYMMGYIVAPIIGLPLGVYLLYQQAGLYGLSGLVAPFVVTLLFLMLQPAISQLREQQAEATSSRMQLMSEIIQAISVIKMYCWEAPLSLLVDQRRRFELGKILKCLGLQSLLMSHHYVVNSVTHFVTVLSITRRGHVLTQGQLVRIFGYVDACSFLMIQVGYFIFNWSEAFRSFSTIQNVLDKCDVANDNVRENEPQHLQHTLSYHKDKSDIVIKVENLQAIWGCKYEPRQTEETPLVQKHNGFTLGQINLNMRKGEFVIIAGPVGAGKTSLLMALLGQLHILSGVCEITKSTAYVSQDPWIFSDTIQNNILFGEILVRRWYSEVIEACGLKKDIDGLPEKDQTQVGEKGYKLSGGQKARIHLARAVYQNKELYLLDDPLAAVDVNVGQHILHNCFCKILADRTRLLVTHNVESYQKADRIVVINKGKIVAIGGYSEVSSVLPDHHFIQPNDESSIVPIVSLSQYIKRDVPEQKGISAANIANEDSCPADNNSVSSATYYHYFKIGHGYFTLLPSVVTCVIFQGAVYFSDYLAVDWANHHEIHIRQNISDQWNISSINKQHEATYIGTIILILFTTVLASGLLLCFIYLASYNIHKTVFNVVLGAPMTFFFVTPIGCIFNVLSRDLSQLDKCLFAQASVTLTWSIQMVGLIILSCIAVPWVILSVIPTILLLCVVRNYGAVGGREFRRMESKCRNPIVSHLSSSLDGHIIIKTYKKEHRFLQRMHELQDLHTSAYDLFLCSNRWSSLYSSWICGFYLTAILVATFVLDSWGTVYGGLLGIVLIQSIGIIVNLQRAVVQSTKLETTMISVEMMLHYAKLPQEHSQNGLNPVAWPTHGRIVFDRVYLKYDSANEYALKNLNFEIKAKEKVGIVGRTGAGKSSLFRVLLRLVQYEGYIYLDNQDIRLINLDKLRKSISVIPQDPLLFSGTIRKNVDPFEHACDDAIWKVLKQVHMAHYVASTSLKLDTDVGEYGSKLSVGQKQLLCLARVLLRKTNLLIVDEATANVDHHTDKMIQDTIRQNFHECTVLTIAHRLNTVMGSDRIMVFSNGELVEFGAPEHLLLNKSGILFKMMNKIKS